MLSGHGRRCEGSNTFVPAGHHESHGRGKDDERESEKKWAKRLLRRQKDKETVVETRRVLLTLLPPVSSRTFLRVANDLTFQGLVSLSAPSTTLRDGCPTGVGVLLQRGRRQPKFKKMVTSAILEEISAARRHFHASNSKEGWT